MGFGDSEETAAPQNSSSQMFPAGTLVSIKFIWFSGRELAALSAGAGNSSVVEVALWTPHTGSRGSKCSSPLLHRIQTISPLEYKLASWTFGCDCYIWFTKLALPDQSRVEVWRIWFGRKVQCGFVRAWVTMAHPNPWRVELSVSVSEKVSTQVWFKEWVQHMCRFICI